MTTPFTQHVSPAAIASRRAAARVLSFWPRERAQTVGRATRTLQSVLALSLLIAGCGAPDAGRDDGGRTLDAGGLDAAIVRDAAAADDGASTDAVAIIDAALPTCPCFDGPGTYCEADVVARGATEGCVALSASATGTRLFACDAAAGWTSTATCAAGCEIGETGASAECSLPICDCFVREAWCGASAARHGITLDPPCRVPLVPEHDTDILACDGESWIVRTACPEGCFEAPTGTADACIDTRVTPADPGWPDCPHRSLLHSGLHPEASDRLRCAGVTSAMITQTIGSAAASAGYHAADGTADGLAYTAAVDLSTRGLTTAEIRTLLARLGENGFAAWYRQPGSDGWPSSEAPHIHGVFAGVIMKSQLRGQVRDYLSGLNGLASHTPYRFWTPSAGTLEIIRLLFSRHYTP